MHRGKQTVAAHETNRGGEIVKPYYEHAGVTIYHGDAREIMPKREGSDMDAKQAREIVAAFEESKKDREYFAIDMAKGYLAALEGPEVKALVEALEKFQTKVRSLEMGQKRKLVLGQTIESASENWDSFPEMFQLDLNPVFQALAAFNTTTGKE